MLKLIIETAIHWMEIGLPLKILKIVVFARNLNHIDQSPLLNYFRNLKGKWEERIKKEREEPEVSCFDYLQLLPIFFAVSVL